ncbi:MAG TPA: DUF6603 domain-containing protein, partial [Actinomycetota bacterium]|nr:DUF6603 domain-containing protein [Actinomycetota bacterium]
SVHVGFDASGPTLSASITPEGGSALVLPILPPATWGDLASLGAGGVQQVLPMLLDAVAAEVPAVGTLGDAFGLRTNGAFDGAKLVALAVDPAAALNGAQVATALQTLLTAAGVPATVSGSTLSFAPVTGLDVDVTTGPTPRLCVSVDPIALRPELSFGGEACVDSAGTFTSQLLLEVTDPNLLDTDPIVLLPFVRIQASSAGPNVLLAGAWNGVPRQAGNEAVAARVVFGSGTVDVVCLIGDYTPAPDQNACIALWAGGLVLPLVADLVLAAQAVKDLLNEALLGETALIGQALHDAGILVRTGDDYAIVGDLLANMETFGRRLVVLGAKLLEATENQILGDALGPLEITPVVEEDGGRRWFGLTLALDEAMTLADGSDVRLELDTSRGTFGGSEPRGLSLFLASHPTGDAAAIRVAPRIAAREIGLRLTGAAGGPLLSDPIGIGEAGLFGTYEGGCTFAGDEVDGWETDGGGVRIAVRRLAVPLTGSDDGGNPVAQKILSQATETSQAGDDEPLAPSVDAELEVGTDGVQLHLGLGDPPWWLPVQRSFGPLYVGQVGLDIEPVDAPNEIAVLFDGGIELAGLSIGVDDLAIIVTLDTRDVAIGLAGLAIGYDSNGLKLAGGLRRHGPDYLGMLQLQFGEFGLTAIGGLGEHPHDGGTYTALFVFGVLTAPLGGPPPFFVTAIGAGFGVNRRLVLPETLDALPQFPLVAAMSPGSDLAQDPMGALDALGQTFPPHRGTFWFAAGVRFTSFVLVESIAVLSVEVGDGLEVALTGISRTTLPRPELPMASVELALRARFSTREGVLAIQAELTENSWLLSSSCRLTGGFAFVVWFRTGQFVLSLGGYHPRFAKPDDFPDLDRLGYHWQVSSVISIKGGQYFALTSSAVMAGGTFEASYRTSWSWASFEMGWNVLIMWDPFAYDLQVYVRISAGVRIRVCVPLLGCATAGFSFSIGANVHVLGPELRGTAVLDLDVTTITVAFGASGDSNADEGLPWDEFRRKYLTDGDTSNGLEAALGNGRYVEAGAPASEAAGAADGPWLLLPEFDVTVTTKTASNRFGSDPVPGVDQIDLGPMRRANVVTDLEVKLFPVADGDADVTGNEGVTLTPRLGQQPEAIWRTHAKSSDAPPAAELVTAVTGATLVVRSKILDRTGEIPVDQVDVGVKVHPLPLRQQVRWRTGLAPWVTGAAALVEWAGSRSVSAAVDLLQTRGTLAAVRERDRWRVAAETTKVALSGAAPALEGLSARASALVTHDGQRAARPVSLAGRAAPPRVRSLGRGTTPPEPTRVEVGVADPPAVAELPAAKLRPRLDAVLHEPTSTAQIAVATRALEVGAGLPRMAAPSLEAVTAEAITSVGAHLHLTRPGTPAARAVGGRAATAMAGDVHEWRTADVKLSSHAAAALQEIDEGLDGDGVALRAGDVHVWRIPDSRRDQGTERPSLHVESEVPVRVVAIDRGGRPLADELLTSGDVAVPAGADRISLAVTGEPGGVAGWHTGTRLARISPTTLLCRRGTVRSEAAASRRSRRETATGLVPAMDVVPTRGTVETTLPATTRTVVLGLSPTTDDVDPEAFAMTLERATRDESDPVVLRVGDRLYGLFGVTPDEDAGTLVAAVRTDARWELAGVLGTEDDPRTAADWIRSGGLTRLAGLVTTPAGSARVRWREPEYEMAR